MTKFQIVMATREHAEALAPRMRKHDIEEVGALGYTPLQALNISVDDSTAAFTVFANGNIIGIFGYTASGLLSDEAFPWLLGSNDLPRYAPGFLRLCREFIAGLRKQFRRLWGSVCVTNAISIRWLTWLGFTIDETVNYPTPGQPGFRNFYMES